MSASSSMRGSSRWTPKVGSQRSSPKGGITLSRDDERPRALAIAGSDSGGGAGIQADLKTFAALGVYGMSAVTAVTVQNTKGVSGYEELSPQTVADQIRAVVTDIGVDAAKTGMLASAAIVEAVADAVAETRVPNLVVDPVFMSKHGHPLLADVRKGKAFVTEAIRHSLAIGQGIGPVDPLWGIRPP